MTTRTFLALLITVPLAVLLVVGFSLTDRSASEAATDGAAMSLRVDASQTQDCPGGPQQGKVCVMLGDKFDVIVVAGAIPLTNGYTLAQAWIDYDSQGLVHKKNSQFIWPDCEAAMFLPLQDTPNNGASASCQTGLLTPPPSFYKGDLLSFSLTCTATQSSSQINLLPYGDPVAGMDGARFAEGGTGASIVPSVTGIQVNCVASPTPTCPPGKVNHDSGCATPTPTPTLTPTPTPSPTPKDPDADTDGDTIPNSSDPNDDNDACTDAQENGPDETLGGLRNPHNPWDFFDVLGPGAALPTDGIIDLPNDILGVLQHFSPRGAAPYDVLFDRGPSTGPHPWNMTAPDGVIDLPNDILGVIQQYNHSCQ